MSDLVMLSGRTIFLYLIILIIFRLMGKREIGELSLVDLIVFIMIAEIAVIGIENANKGILTTLVPMAVLLIVQIGFAYLSLKFPAFRGMMEGKPTVIIKDGKIDEQMMKSQRYNFDDLLLQLREKGVKKMADVEFAILETSGKLSIYEKDKSGKKKTPPPLTEPLILDGEIQQNNLDQIHKSKVWLKQELKKRGYPDTSAISYCSYCDGKFHIDVDNRKDNK